MTKTLLFIGLCIFLCACSAKDNSSPCRLRNLNGKAYESGINRFTLSVSGDNVIMKFHGDQSGNSTFTFKLKDCELQGTGPMGNATIIDDKIIFAGQEYGKQSCRVEQLDGNCYIEKDGEKIHLEVTTENSIIMTKKYMDFESILKFKLNGCRLELDQPDGYATSDDYYGKIIFDKIFWNKKEWTRIACEQF